jgi:hypothetical protein
MAGGGLLLHIQSCRWNRLKPKGKKFTYPTALPFVLSLDRADVTMRMPRTSELMSFHRFL